jgi:hypothetical protein
MKKLIFVSLESWDDIWRRNQFVCAELARRYPDMRILFVCPPRDVSNAIRTRRLGLLRGPNNWHPEGFPNITVTRPLKLLPSTLAIGRWVNDLMPPRRGYGLQGTGYRGSRIQNPEARSGLRIRNPESRIQKAVRMLQKMKAQRIRNLLPPVFRLLTSRPAQRFRSILTPIS